MGFDVPDRLAQRHAGRGRRRLRGRPRRRGRRGRRGPRRGVRPAVGRLRQRRPPPVTVRAAAARSGRDRRAGLDARAGTPSRTPSTRSTPGLHVMVFSDNVPLEQEVALKEYADAAGVLVMGPDCGTAVVGGVGLGFANVVRPGPVGHRGRLRHRRAAPDVRCSTAPASASRTASGSAAATCRRRSAAGPRCARSTCSTRTRRPR